MGGLYATAILVLAGFVPARIAQAAGGTLTLRAIDEGTGEPVITRLEVRRGQNSGRPLALRRAVPAGVGTILDRELQLSLSDGSYRFRAVRGPEYRIVTGQFSLERTSEDTHSVRLPRMVDMLAEGWTSGDCCVLASPHSLPLRMAAEDLHLARALGEAPARMIPGRDRTEQTPAQSPLWIDTDAAHQGGLLFYGLPTESRAADRLPVQNLAEFGNDPAIRVAIENPFAWALPVWLASDRIDGFFVLGDWLRLDKKILRVSEGRGPVGLSLGGNKAVGRWAERIYWNLLDAGFRIPPLAGCGSEGGNTPVGYNRLYVAEPLDSTNRSDGARVGRVGSSAAWWDAAWKGRSVATNGPLLRPRLDGELPGFVFNAAAGDVLELHPQLVLTVRDPVDYLQVIHNGRVHYNARLDEYAKAGGQIPPVIAKESGWVIVRVVTQYEDHFRAALSAPWYIDFDGRPRTTTAAVTFFREWLAEHEERLKKLPPQELARQVPFVRAARGFWAKRAALARD